MQSIREIAEEIPAPDPGACNCITEINNRLREDGRELDLLTDPTTLKPVIPISTRWIDGSKRAKKLGRIAASNCSFCGVSYDSKTT